MTSHLLAPRTIPAQPVKATKSARWLHVLTNLDPKYGGLSSAVPALVEHLTLQAGLEVSIAAFCAPGERIRIPSLTPEQLTYWPSSQREWFLNKKLQRDFSELLQRFDGIHIHGLWEQSTRIAASCARQLRLPYVISAHGMLEPWALSQKKLKKIIYSSLIERRNVSAARWLHGLTPIEGEQYRRFGAPRPVCIVPNGVDIPEQKDASLLLAEFPVLRGKRLVLFLSRLDKKKGIDLLLAAWAEIAGSHPNAHLVVAGPDGEGTRRQLEQFVSYHHLAERVTFTGMLNAQLRWSAMAAAEVFVLPSHSEGLSMAVLEAMGMGLPVLITPGCNMPAVKELELGWEVAAETPALGVALHRILADSPVENARRGARGARLVQSNYTWPIVARKMASVYRWVAGESFDTAVEMAFTECEG